MQQENEANELVVRVEKLVAGGQGLCRSEGGVCFVAGVLPGELVRLKLKQQRRGYVEAELLEVLEISPARCQPLCSVYQHCGGCQWQHINYAQQLEQKKAIAVEALFRQAKLSLPPVAVVASEEWAYRSRFRFAAANNGHWGLRERRGHTVEALDCCLLASPAINAFLERQKVSIAAAERGSVLNVVDRRGGELAAVAAGISSGSELASWSYQGQRLAYLPELFFQCNHLILPKLIDWMAEQLDAALLSQQEAWDLYAGVGLFSKTLLQQRFERIQAVEAGKLSAEWLQHNLQNSAAKVQCQSVEEFLAQQNLGAVALLDPPRAGLSKEVQQQLLRLRSPMLLYVSCDPVTWARDIAALAPVYSLESWAIFDFYPQTSEIELASLLRLL